MKKSLKKLHLLKDTKLSLEKLFQAKVAAMTKEICNQHLMRAGGASLIVTGFMTGCLQRLRKFF